jgi:hypothetical protein
MPRHAHSFLLVVLLPILLLSAGSLAGLHAQNNDGDASFLTNAAIGTETKAPGAPKAPSTQTISRTDENAIAVSRPSTESPFFIERQEAKAALAKAGREGYGMYVPKPPHPPVQQQVKKFFKGMFGSLKFNKNSNGAVPMTLTVEPAEFSITETPELDVSLKLSNARKQEIELLYPNNQRLEVLTKDALGNVLSRWSEDRAFDPYEGFVAVNPDEFIIYAERISTAKMKAGETYTIEASLANQEGYSATTTVKPRP